MSHNMCFIAGVSETAIVAWWGAIIATIVLLWDIYKWKKKGPRLSLEIRSDMEVMGDKDREGKVWIMVEVANNGDRATTLDKLMLVFYKTYWQRV